MKIAFTALVALVATATAQELAPEPPICKPLNGSGEELRSIAKQVRAVANTAIQKDEFASAYWIRLVHEAAVGAHLAARSLSELEHVFATAAPTSPRDNAVALIVFNKYHSASEGLNSLATNLKEIPETRPSITPLAESLIKELVSLQKTIKERMTELNERYAPK
jgi:hypothetical protein